ncbi:unnamed protein product [Anisakis simplex]|uniref:protein-tyrosine-phosphatase n=1 Tax=Anisakis simplex TaxID=6269 RepID=A0A0M3K1E7_ANISI|nr:unnamed protein product [Anisakis simplex]
MIDKIIDCLYISDANSVISQRGQKELQKLQITHILTVSAMGIPERSQLRGVEYKFLFVMDSITQDILANNLLSCEVGVSRSVAFVVAYLMRRFQWSLDKALLHVRTARPIAHPNDGFLHQLNVFQMNGYKADVHSLSSNQDYRRWCSMNGIAPVGAHANSFSAFLDLASMPSLEGNNEPCASKVEYRCRKCRKALFYDEHLVKHNISSSKNTANIHQNYSYSNNDPFEECKFGILLTPMKWMDLSCYEGKILCPSCSEKLGNYVWGGRICLGIDGMKCGTAVRPWVNIHKDKVDVKYATDGTVADCVNAMIVHPPPSVIPRIIEPGDEPELDCQPNRCTNESIGVGGGSSKNGNIETTTGKSDDIHVSAVISATR